MHAHTHTHTYIHTYILPLIHYKGCLVYLLIVLLAAASTAWACRYDAVLPVQRDTCIVGCISMTCMGWCTVQAVVIAEKHSVAAAKELSALAVARHPHSKALTKRHAALKGPSAAPASKQDPIL